MAEIINGTTDILGGSVIRYNLNTTTPNQAVIRKIIAGNGISITSTGVDPGTGDVTISVDISGGGSGGTGTGGSTGSGGGTTTGGGASNVGTVTSVNMTVPTGLTILGAPITSAGTLALKLSSGYSIPLTSDISKAIQAYSKTVAALTFNTTNGVLTITQQDGGGVVAAITLSPFTTTTLAEGSNLYFTDTRARAAISETITGIDYSNSTGVFSLTSGYVIPTTVSAANWDTAYSWGNHALAGYLTSGSFVSDYDSDISGLRNSSNKVYTLTNPYRSGTTKVYVNGVRYSPGADNDYTESAANQITFTNAPDSGDLILVDYIKS